MASFYELSVILSSCKSLTVCVPLFVSMKRCTQFEAVESVDDDDVRING